MKFLVASLLISAVLFFSSWSSVTASDQCPPTQVANPNATVWYNMFKAAIFKVYSVDTNGKIKEARGTATLIDRRGYFLTASHIVENLDGFKWGGPYPRQLKLVNSENDITLDAVEVAHRSSKTAPDVSLLKATVPPFYATLVHPVDVLLDYETPSQLIMMIGYPYEKNEIQMHPFSPLNYSPGKRDTLFVVIGGAFHGQSGSLALNQEGRAIGVLHKRDEDDKITVHFTTSVAVRDLLTSIQPTDQVLSLLELLASGEIKNLKLALKVKGISALEAIMLVERFIKDEQKYKAYVEELIEPFYWTLSCNNLHESAIRFLRSHPAGVISSTVKYEAAKEAYGVYKSLEKVGVKRDDRKFAIEFAKTWFEQAENTYKATTAGPILSDFLTNHARVLHEAKTVFPEMGIQKISIEGKIDQAISANTTNYFAYDLKGDLSGDYTYYISAAEAAKVKYTEAPPSDKIIAEQDWRVYMEKAINSLPEENPKKVDLSNRLGKGIETSSAPKFKSSNLDKFGFWSPSYLPAPSWTNEKLSIEENQPGFRGKINNPERYEIKGQPSVGDLQKSLGTTSQK